MNNQQMSAKDFHKRAERAREHGSFVESLNFCELAFEIYARESNGLGMAEVLSSMVLSLRHLSEKYDDDINYLKRAKHVAEASVEIAKDSGNAEAYAIPLFNLANVYFSLKDFKNSAKFYKEAIKKLPDSAHNSPSQMANMKINLEVSLYRTGDKKALTRFLKIIEELENSEEKKYEKDVWVSGGYMRMGEAIYKDQKTKAREFLGKAKEIIEGNEELKLRKAQLKKLEDRLL